jgi:hypothetical protein
MELPSKRAEEACDSDMRASAPSRLGFVKPWHCTVAAWLLLIPLLVLPPRSVVPSMVLALLAVLSASCGIVLGMVALGKNLRHRDATGKRWGAVSAILGGVGFLCLLGIIYRAVRQMAG